MGLKEQDIVFTTTDESGNKVLQMPITRYENVEGILDFVYPIGSLYWSKNAADPGNLFGGTWKRIKDTFILAAGDSYAQGASGGTASVTLTTNQIPSHTHSGTASSSSIPRHIHGVSTMGNNNGSFYAVGEAIAFDNYGGQRFWNGSGGGGGYNSSPIESAVVITSYEKEIEGTTGSHSHTLSIAAAGGGAAHENMPPYVTYYCWERTA